MVAGYMLFDLDTRVVQTRRLVVDDLGLEERRDAVLFLKRVYMPPLFVTHDGEFVSQLYQALGVGHQRVDDLLVDLNAKG